MEWIAALQGARSASNLVQDLLKLRTGAEVQTKVVELNGVLLNLQGELNTAQAEYGALLGRVRELEEQVEQFERWEEEKQRYQLHEFATGAIAYVIKAEDQGDDPTQYLCSTCYQRRVKSFLQPNFDRAYARQLQCNNCQAVIVSETWPRPKRKTGVVKSRF